jgi:hypothetical protein
LRLDGKVRSYHLVAVEADAALDATLARATDGSRLDPLIDALVDDEITREDAADYVEQLVESQILVSDVAPQVTGPEPIYDLIAQLQAQEQTRPAGIVLDGAREQLAALDGEPPGVAHERYHTVAAALAQLPGEVEQSRLFQVDMVKPAKATLGQEPLAEIIRAVELLQRVGTARRSDALTRFRDAFVRRYEGCEVPLVEALDEEMGIGFHNSTAPTADASPLLESLAFPGGERDEMVLWGARQKYLFGKLEAVVRSGARELVLDEKDLRKIETSNPPPLPHSMAAMAILAASSEQAFASGAFRVFIPSVLGPSGANLLGRFCHGDPELHRRVVAHLRDEEAQRPDAIFAKAAWAMCSCARSCAIMRFRISAVPARHRNGRSPSTIWSSRSRGHAWSCARGVSAAK